jgi:tetratricopeptide (TPR) repeat protein
LTKAESWSLAGRQDLALAEVVRVLNLDRKNPDALRLAVVLALELRNPDLRAATRKRLDLLKEARPDDANVRLLEARFDESTEQPKEAIAVYEAALKNDPKLNDAYARLINLLLKQGDKAKTREYVQRWRKEQPHSVPAMQAEVRLLAENKEAGQVRKLVETFIDQQLARERKRLEAEKPAAGADPKETEKARQDRLERFRLRLQLDLTRGLMQGKAWSEAGTWLNEVLAKHPDDVTTLVLLGDLHVSQQSWDKARVVYEKVLALDKTNGVAGNNLAWILAKHLNKAPEALRLVQEARKGRFSHKPISGDRLRPEFLDTLGLIYTKMEKGSLYADMRDVFEAARHRWPHDPRICAYLGNAYAGLLEMDRAERWYAAAIEIANKSGQQFLSPQQCKEVIDEVHLAQKKIKQTAQR